MGLTPAAVDAHLARWRRALESPHYPHRKHWPARLYHHAPLENAVDILREGVLRSRNDPRNMRRRDVAAPGVIDARSHAHNSVRLYFRPKTPTQYHIEGIRRDADRTYEAHAPVLVMFTLDARTILTREDVRFSDRNMQLGSAHPGDDQAYFDAIPFEKVYSEGPNNDRSVINARCAEVMTTSPLELDGCLREIYLRSEPERDTLLHMLGRDRHRWARFCNISDALKVFQKDFAFVKEVGLTPEGVTFVLNPRRDRQSLDVKIDVHDQDGRHLIDFQNKALDAKPPAHARWIHKRKLNPGIYLVRIHVDGHLAYESLISLEDTLF